MTKEKLEIILVDNGYRQNQIKNMSVSEMIDVVGCIYPPDSIDAYYRNLLNEVYRGIIRKEIIRYA